MFFLPLFLSSGRQRSHRFLNSVWWTQNEVDLTKVYLAFQYLGADPRGLVFSNIAGDIRYDIRPGPKKSYIGGASTSGVSTLFKGVGVSWNIVWNCYFEKLVDHVLVEVGGAQRTTACRSPV